MAEILIASVEEIGKRLKERRKAAGLTAFAMGQKLGVRDSSYGRWESGAQEGGCKSVAEAGAALGMTPNELFLAALSEIEAPSSDGLPEECLHNLRRVRELVSSIYKKSGGKIRADQAVQRDRKSVV